MDSGSSSKIGLKLNNLGGFFSTDGKLKSKEQLIGNVEKTSAKTSKESSDLVGEVLGKVELRFLKQVETAANDLNRRESQVKQVKSDLNKEKESLIRLKDAFEGGDLQQIEETQAELGEIRILKAERLAQVNLEQRVGGSSRSISFGNSGQGQIELAEIDVEGIKLAPENKKQANQQLQQVKEDLQAVKALRAPLKAAREALASVLSEGQKRLEGIQDASLKSFDKAEGLASDISNAAAYLTEDQLISSVFSKINPTLLPKTIG